MKTNFVTNAYVVHMRAYRNTSALIDFFSESHGLVRVVANGLYGHRKQQLHWKGVLRPLQPLQVTWRGESGLKTLIDIEGDNRGARSPQGQYLYCAFYINELLQRCLTNQEGDSALFAAYQQCAQALVVEDDMHISLRRFELSLLQALGYGIDFSCDVHGMEIDSEKFYQFDPHAGFCLHTKDMRYAIPGDCLLALAVDDFQSIKVKAVAKYILREALSPHLGSKAIESRSLFADL